MILIISLRAFKTNGNNLITNNTLNKFKVILDNNVLKEHRPKFYSNETGISLQNLNQLLKENYNKTTTEIIHEKLISIAKSKLYTTTLSIKEISNYLGIEDPLYFSRLFKNKTGFSPKQFRTSLQTFINP